MVMIKTGQDFQKELQKIQKNFFKLNAKENKKFFISLHRAKRGGADGQSRTAIRDLRNRRFAIKLHRLI